MVRPDFLNKIDMELSRNGLARRGRILRSSEFEVAGKALILIGNIGREMWPHFIQSGEYKNPNSEQPLDKWVKRIVTPLARELGATAFYPSDQPYQPFQQWALKSEELYASPMGMLVHPQYGLWHAYRAAIVFENIESFEEDSASCSGDDSCRSENDSSTSEVESNNSPCVNCLDKPCLSGCPVKAFRNGIFYSENCAAHLVEDLSQTCNSSGCLARNACPVGAQYRYMNVQQSFHMRAFMKVRI